MSETKPHRSLLRKFNDWVEAEDKKTKARKAERKAAWRAMPRKKRLLRRVLGLAILAVAAAGVFYGYGFTAPIAAGTLWSILHWAISPPKKHKHKLNLLSTTVGCPPILGAVFAVIAGAIGVNTDETSIRNSNEKIRQNMALMEAEFAAIPEDLAQGKIAKFSESLSTTEGMSKRETILYGTISNDWPAADYFNWIIDTFQHVDDADYTPSYTLPMGEVFQADRIAIFMNLGAYDRKAERFEATSHDLFLKPSRELTKDELIELSLKTFDESTLMISCLLKGDKSLHASSMTAGINFDWSKRAEAGPLRKFCDDVAKMEDLSSFPLYEDVSRERNREYFEELERTEKAEV